MIDSDEMLDKLREPSYLTDLLFKLRLGRVRRVVEGMSDEEIDQLIAAIRPKLRSVK